MYIKMVKQAQDNECVRYRAEVDIPGEQYIDERGKTRLRVETKYAEFSYHIAEEHLEFDSESSDSYYLTSSRLYQMCYIKMSQCKAHSSFPDVVT